MMVTIRSSSSDVMSPALYDERSAQALEKLQGPMAGLGAPPLVEIYIGFLTHEVGVTAPDTLNFGQGVHDLLFSIDVGVEETKDELEIRLLSRDERYHSGQSTSSHFTVDLVHFSSSSSSSSATYT